MYFKTKNGPVHVSPIAVKEAMYASASGSDPAPFYKSPYYWVAVVAVLALIAVMVYCLKTKKDRK